MKNSLAKLLNKLKNLDRFRLFISFLLGFCLTGLFNLTLALAGIQSSYTWLTISDLLCITILPFLIYRVLSISWKRRLPYLVGLLLLGSFLTGMFYEKIDGTLSDLFGFFLFMVPLALVPVTALSIPFAIWCSLSLGKKVYLSLWSFYAVLFTIFWWPNEPHNDTEEDFFPIGTFILLAVLCLAILIIHLWIIRKYSQLAAKRKNSQVSGTVHIRRIVRKLALIALGTLALAGIYLVLNHNWTPSKEFQELENQEKALSLPKADERIAKDRCYWTEHKESADEKVRHCYQSINLSYNNITLAGQIRDRLVANGWKEEGYVQHLGGTRLGDPPTLDQISQGAMPTLSSNSDYFFTAKQGQSLKICAEITIFAKGDARNPTDPKLNLTLTDC